MPEIKRNFASGKMNKDLDERLFASAAKGQYRDALNIQISTTDSDDIGTAQNIKGNTQITNMFDFTTIDVRSTASIVGKVAAPDEDKIYYFVSDGDFSQNNLGVPFLRKNYIIEFDTVAQVLKYVFVDIFEVRKQTPTGQTGPFVTATPETTGGGTNGNKTGIRIGMHVSGTFTNGSGGNVSHPITGATLTNGATYQVFKSHNVFVTDIQWDSSNSRWKIFTSTELTVSANDIIKFSAPSALEFDKETLITGINVLDGNIYWTDDKSEPKKINIERSIKGTGGSVYLRGATSPLTGFNNTNTTLTSGVFNGDSNYFHTRLVKDVNNDGTLRVVTTSDKKKAIYADRKYVTVIKKGPTQPLHIEMYRSSEPRVNNKDKENPISTTHTNGSPSVFRKTSVSPDLVPLEAGATVSISFDTPVDYRVGDIIFFIPQDEDEDNSSAYSNVIDPQDAAIRAKVISSNVVDANSLASSGFEITILSISEQATNLTPGAVYNVRRKVGEALFEYSFPRFSYRYKYQDGEYSTFAPWSETAFLPDYYEYFPKKGFNLGMRNQLRCLKLRNYFFPNEIMPQDVVEIDLLYKETNNPTVYTIKTLKPTDGDPIWPNLKANPNTRTDNGKPNRGVYNVTTDLVHAVVPSNQLLRPFDNVPRKAKAQEISANRVVYGNYLQNYTVEKDPVLVIGTHSRGDEHFADEDYARPSVKSIRNYQIGVVFSDEYGRETPVLTSKDAMINLDQSVCNKRNRITARLWDGTQIPSWAKYFSFYIKETSSEYYSLAMDRWYNAADGNVWLSFPSSERNKLDEETFLILKKAHGNDNPVTQKARYKILAIENEAPDFIKTTKKSLGTFFNSGSNNIGNSTRGYPLQDTTFITCNLTTFEAVYGVDAHLDFASVNKMGIIFSGQNSISKEYEIAKISKLSGTDYKIKLAGKIEDDVSFASSDDTWAGRIGDLQFELIEYEVENKPEFDGRFFVKVYRDQILEDNVLNSSENALEYVVAASWQLRYLNNHAYKSSSYTNGSNWTSQTSSNTQNKSLKGPIIRKTQEKTGTSQTDRYFHPTEYNHHSGATFPNANGSSATVTSNTYRWGGATGDSTGSLKGAQVPVTGNGLRAFDMRHGHNHAMNDDTWSGSSGGSGFTPAAREFWQYASGLQDFFIDASTAFSWTSMEENFNKIAGGGRDRPGNEYASDTWSAGEVACGKSGTTYGVKGSPSGKCSNTKYEKGQPSRGIWFGPNDECYMDLAWTGMGKPGQEDGGWPGSGPYPEKLSETTATIYKSAQNFIETLCTPGTKFRFRKDPDETIYTAERFDHPDCGWNSNKWRAGGANETVGVWGIRNYKTRDPYQTREQHESWNKRQRWTLKVTPRIGDNGSENEYNPVTGTIFGAPSPVRALHHDTTDADVIEILRPYVDLSGEGRGNYTENPAIWETEPKESVDVDIYYQVGGLIPIELTTSTNEEFLPLGSTFRTQDSTGTATTHTITEWTAADTFTFTPAIPNNAANEIADNEDVYFEKRNHYNLGCNANGAVAQGATSMKLHGMNRFGTSPLWKEYHVLDWNNCWCFLNGAESDRARDDFNQKQMDNGVKASTVLAEPVREERREHGFIWSGIYNSNSGVNDTNQFIMAEAITKDLNPEYGSIQKLHQRNTDLITLCEDKVLKVLSNKDALFNADGNSNVTATAKVLGAATPYKGNYGISKNPESFVATPYQLYFGDAMRGQICALSGEGVRTISTLGMKNYFSDILKENVHQLLGTYDQKKKEYNVTIKKKLRRYQEVAESTTVSYNEKSKGWVSFKSFIPQDGISLNNQYYTWYNGGLWKHHSNVLRNNFYGTQYNSDITLIFADPTASVKSFDVMAYEGSQEKISPFTTESKDFFTGDSSSNNGIDSTSVNASDFGSLSYRKLTTQVGWYVDSIDTDLQAGNKIYFVDKEGKKYGYVTGKEGGIDNVDTNWNEKEFSTQGIGTATIEHGDPDKGEGGTWTIKNNVSSTYVGDDNSGGAWDSQNFGNN